MNIETRAAHHGAAPRPELRVLTVRRPWARLIADGIKPVENRVWATKHRGVIAIHAGNAFEPAAPADAIATRAGRYLQPGYWAEDQHPTGIVAVAELTGVCADSTDSPHRVRCACGPWAVPGQYHWRLSSVRPLVEPVPVRGGLGLRRLPADVEARIWAQIEVAS